MIIYKNTSLSGTEKLSLIDSIGTMLTAGIPILDTVESMLTEAKGNQRTILETLKEDLNQGINISESFERFPRAFNPIIVSLIKAAEEAGTLETTLKDLTISIKKEIEFTDKIKAALLYPVLVFILFNAVFLFILTFAIPRIASVFSRLKITLPLPTRILIAVSNVLTSYTIFIILGVILLVIIIVFLYKVKKAVLVNFFVNFPLISKITRLIDLTQFTRSLSLLLAAGVPINQALNLSVDVVNKREIKTIIEDSKKSISAGRKLSTTFKKYEKLIPSIMIRVTEAGEKSASLDKSMQDLNEYFENRISTTLKSITVLFEPIFLIFVGLLVAVVMLAIIAPIYGLIGKISAR